MTKPKNPPMPATPDRVAAALACIPSNVDRETWVRLGMAVKAELGAEGFDLWNEWSKAADNYRATEARDTWRSIKAGGAVTIGTLFGIAKGHGYKVGRTRADARTSASSEEAAIQASLRQKARAVEEAAYRARADKAAREAQRMWNEALLAGSSGYLQRKSVGAHGIRLLGDGTVLVPMRDQAGVIQNLQRIAPVKPADGKSDKRFLPGGRKTGLFHWVGEPAGAPVLLLAEGYATGASIHECTGRPVAVGFDAGNLVHVAKALRALFPSVPVLVCGDDDTDTAARTGTNPGRVKAAAAARAIATDEAPADAVFPVGLAPGHSDFNDLANTTGPDVVRLLIDQAVAAMRVAPRLVVGTEAPSPLDRAMTRQADGGEPDADSAPGARTPAGGGRGGWKHKSDGDGDEPPPDWDPFSVNDVGVWHTARDAEGNKKRPQWVCSRLDVTARTRADDTNMWGYLLEFSDPDGNRKSWAMPAALLTGDAAHWAGRLSDMGLDIAPGPAARNLVAKYIGTRKLVDRVVCTDRVGWHGPVYVLPSSSIAPADADDSVRRYVFQSASGMEDNFRRAGTLAQWQEEVGARCVGNSRMAFAVCCAFAGPMLRLAEIESGGVHFRGDSSQGKTTALRVAASVWGRPSYLQRWRTTSNALETIAVQHSDALLVLDEFGQLDPREAGDVAYMLANESEKGRSTSSSLLRKRRTWKLLFLSSGEVSLAQHMELAGKTPRAGQEVRMLDIPLDAGAGMGGIEQLHGFDRPAVLADAIVSAAAHRYGTAGRAWLEWACDHFAELPRRLVDLVDQHRDEMVPAAAAEQVRRAGTRFALIAAAGELATEAGITSWPAGQAAWAARRCFEAWLESRGHMFNGEEAAMLRQVRRFLELHAEGRLTWWHRSFDDHAPKTLNRAGFRVLKTSEGETVKSNSDYMSNYGERISASDAQAAHAEYLIFAEAFNREVCQGFDPKAVAELLRKRGHLVHEPGRLTYRHRLPLMGGDKIPVFQIKPSIFDDDLSG